MTLELSCALVPGMDSPEHTRIAESLGCERAYFTIRRPCTPTSGFSYAVPPIAPTGSSWVPV